MKLQELRARVRLASQVAEQFANRPAQSCLGIRLLVLGAVICALSILSGCQDYNPYLGATASQSSAITFVAPAAAYAGCSGFTLDIQGGAFISGAVVLWNGSPRTTTFETSTELLATINASDIASPGFYPVAVSLPGQIQGNDQSNTVTFTVNTLPANGTCPAPPVFAPNISGLSETSGKVGDSITIAGNYFGDTQGSSTVTFNGTAATIPANTSTTTYWSGTSITTTVPAGTKTGPVVVTVGSLQSNGVIFSVISGSAVSATASASVASSLSVGVGNPVSATPEGRYVAFVSSAPDDSGVSLPDQIYLRDTCKGASSGCSPQTTFVSTGLDGAAPNGPSSAPSVSADGRFVAFVSSARNLVPDDDNGVADIFVRDTCIGAGSGCLPTTARVSLGPASLEANGASSDPAIGPNGRFVAFASTATNLTLDPSISLVPGSPLAYLRDTCFGATDSCTPSTSPLVSSSPAQ